jgi:Ricin-type beta-trefoil lectin domain-like
MEWFMLKSWISNMALSSTGLVGSGPGKVGSNPVLEPVDSQLDQFVYAFGVTSSSGKHAYRLTMAGETALDIPAFSTTAGTPVQQWSINNGDNQLWTLLPTENANKYNIMNVHSGLVLDVPAFSKQPGQTIQQWGMNGGDNQAWSLVEPTQLSSLTVSETGAYPSNAGAGCKVVGSGFDKNAQYSMWFMNVPQQPQNQAIQLLTPLSGDAQLAPQTHCSSDANGAINFTLVCPAIWRSGMAYDPKSPFPRPTGTSVLVLEDSSGYAAGFATLDQSAFAEPVN